VPSITSQVRKGDPTRMGNELLAVRGAVEQFLSDVRRYPRDMSQLTAVITTSQFPLPGTGVNTYGTPEVNRWRGPYLSKDGTAALATGFGLSFTATFDTVSLLTTQTSSCTPTCGQKYMVLSIGMPANSDTIPAFELDKLFDDGVLTTGSIRLRKCATANPTACTPGTSPDTIKFLMMPVY